MCTEQNFVSAGVWTGDADAGDTGDAHFSAPVDTPIVTGTPCNTLFLTEGVIDGGPD